MVQHFNDSFIGLGADGRNNLWLLWHVKEFVLGHHALFRTDLLYYPEGISLLLRGLGPFVGFMALPFWLFLEPAGVYNASILVQFILTGYCTYLFARTLRLSRSVAFLAGMMLLVAPLHLAGLFGHMTKTFLALIPLTLLCLSKALQTDGRRAYVWAMATGVGLLFLLLHNGYQFVYTALALPPYVLFYGWRLSASQRHLALRRAAVALVSCVILCLPLLVAIQTASHTAGVRVDLSQEAQERRPDFLELFIPSNNHFLLGGAVQHIRTQYGLNEGQVERAVYLGWTQLLLATIACIRGSREGRFWTAFAFVCALLALGPTLRFLGQDEIPFLSQPVPLPYSWLIQLPGLGFMRVSGRVMMIGYLGLALAASMGVRTVLRRHPQQRRLILLLVGLLIMGENWPANWRLQRLRPLPVPYQQLAEDQTIYGVADFPVRGWPTDWAVGFSSHYQMYQMSHNKALMMGYLARSYPYHPVFPCLLPTLRLPEPDILVDGVPSDCAANFLLDLARSNYRLLTFHKDLDRAFREGEIEQSEAWPILQRFFATAVPQYEDEQVITYVVESQPDPAQFSPVMGIAGGWGEQADGRRWAVSPATLFLSLPEATAATLQMQAAGADAVPGLPGPPQMQISLDGETVEAVSFVSGELLAIPLQLPAGIHHLEFRILQPDTPFWQPQSRQTFAVKRLELLTHR